MAASSAVAVSVGEPGDLHDYVVHQCAGTKAKQLRREPIIAEGFLHHYEIGQRLLGGPAAAGRLHANTDAGGEEEIADGFQHHQRDRQGGGRGNLAGAGLDEIRAGAHGDFAVQAGARFRQSGTG